MLTQERLFAEFLTRSGLKFTPERRIVLEEIFKVRDHFEVEDLLLRIRQNGRRVSKGTIYRTLKLLEDCGLVRQVAFTDKHTHYEYVYGHEHHEHLICRSCGQVIDFCREEIERALEEICAQNSFVMESHKVEVVGLCSLCRKKKP